MQTASKPSAESAGGFPFYDYRLARLVWRLRGDTSSLNRLLALWDTIFVSERVRASTARLFVDVAPHETLEDDQADNPMNITEIPDGYVITMSGVRVRLEPPHAHLTVAPTFWASDLARQRHVVLVSVLAMLQGLGHYSLHASGLVTDGRAVLASGPSGSGKTTLALSLLAQGWHYLSDDVTLLSVSDADRGGSVLAKTLTRGFSCTDDTLERFSHLADVPVLFRNAKDKRVIDIARHYPSRVAHEAPVGLILFPQVARTTTTRLERLEPAQALLRLIPQTAGVKQRSQQVLEHLSALVKQAPAFALYLGYDLYHYPERVAEQIRGALTDES